MNQRLARYLWELAQGSRWFSARGSTLAGVELGPWVSERLRPAYLDVNGADGVRQRFFVPLSYRDPQHPIDACDDGEVLLEALRSGAEGFEARAIMPEGLPARRYKGEQSNTTVFFGDQALAKVFRRLEPGRNVEVELQEALAGSGVVAELLGTWRNGDTDLAIFLEALPEPSDGYVVACEFAREKRAFGEHALALGGALAIVHRVLAERLPTGSADGGELAEGWRTRFEEAAAEVPALAGHRTAARAIFDAVADGPVMTQRIHGDCHLGQVLLSRGQWRYVDFEGEPLKSLTQRRLPDSPLRDVAGMLRSLAYAAAAGDAPAGWLQESRAAFLTGYGVAEGSPLLTAYEADKAAYEARYEFRYRPHLIDVPLSYWLTNQPHG